MQTNLEILSSIRQGNDTCTLQSICVPVPIENPDPGVLVFPRCYEVMQMFHGKSNLDTNPFNYHRVLQIVEMVYAGQDRFVINQTLNITMEQHQACSCRDCTLDGVQPECQPGHVIGASCTCECGNQIEKHNCKG
uniref:Uncharacterized protein n=1 Tax=Parascaris equorum TaxID=6256 RepID=A0A914RCY5_PAREQ